MELLFWWGKQKESEVLGLSHWGRLRAKQTQDVGRQESDSLILFRCKACLMQVVMLTGDVGVVAWLSHALCQDIVEVLRVDTGLQWDGGGKLDVCTLHARSLVLKGGSWRGS